MKYIITLGSNLKPNQHIPWALAKMLEAYPCMTVGRFFRTQAYAMSSKYIFWNGAALIDTPLSHAGLKEKLCEWEVQSGRDRVHPQCSFKDRTLDLDIVWSHELGWLDSLSTLKGLPYLWCPVSSLFRTVSYSSTTQLKPVWFRFKGRLLGRRRICFTKA